MTKYLIVGGSVGAVGAIEAIREIDNQGEIAVVSQEPYQAYSRPMISEYLAGKAGLNEIAYRPASFYTENAVNLILGKRVTAIDTAEHWAEIDGKEKIHWDKLLLATGGVPIRPPLNGIDKQGIFHFTNLADAQALDKAITEGAKTAAVIGGGLIGVSVCEALVQRGVKVTLIELQDRLLSLSLDQKGSEIVSKAMSNIGIDIITGHAVTSITGNSSAMDTAGGVVLDDGRHITSDIVILAIGVKPNVELAKQAGLEVSRGIVVDDHMATSAPDVYACGDVAEALTIDGVKQVVPLWPVAHIGGRTAGRNMAGQDTVYPGSFSLSTLKYFGIRMVSAGASNGDAAPDTESFVTESKGVYKRVTVRNGRVVGLLFSGDVERSGLVFGLMRDGVDVSAFQDSLVADDFGMARMPADFRAKRWRRDQEVDDEGLS